MARAALERKFLDMASVLITALDGEAAAFAGHKADQLMEEGDLVGSWLCQRVREAILYLQPRGREAGSCTETDISRCAIYLTGLHGPKVAATRALLRASTLYERGERDAANIWFQVGSMIQRMEP